MSGQGKQPAQGVGRLIVHGIEGKQNDVDSVVYDAPYVRCGQRQIGDANTLGFEQSSHARGPVQQNP